MKKAVCRDRLYCRMEDVTQEMLEAFQSQIIIGEDPHSKEPLYDTFHHYEILPSQEHIAFNRGDWRKIQRLFHDFEIKDERIDVPMQNRLKLKFPEGLDFRKYQIPAIEAFTQDDDGILKSPARSGKTLMMTAAMCLERQKTIVFAHQTDLLVQMLDTFENFTNLKELQTKSNRIVGIAEEWSDFEELDIVLCTKQTFDNPKNLGKASIIQQMFGSVYIDEVHWLPGEIYSKLVNRCWARRRRGVTATPIRKDQMSVMMWDIVGPVRYEIQPADVGYCPLKVLVIPTGIKSTGQANGFVSVMSYLSKLEVRNTLMADRMARDCQAGMTVIAVTDRKPHTIEMVERLRGLGVKAEAFNGNQQKREIRTRILNGIRVKDTQALICMRQMTTGLDIPRANSFHNLLPSGNVVQMTDAQKKINKETGEDFGEGEGGYYQQCTRVQTPYEGKDVALIRDYQDAFGIAYGCFQLRKKTYARLGAKIEFEKEAPDTRIIAGATSSTSF